MDIIQIQTLAEEGDAKAQYTLGNIYYTDWMAKLYRVKHDLQKAAEWFAKSAEQGNPDAQCQLAAMYSGHGLGYDYGQAVQLNLRSAEKGDMTAMRNLGIQFAEGKGVRSSPDIAEQCFIAAAVKGGMEQEYELGHRYQYGSCLSVNHVKAVSWYKKAAEKHHLPSLQALVHVYDHAIGVRQNHIQADFYRELAEEVEGVSGEELAKRYENFPGTLRNVARLCLRDIFCSPNARIASEIFHEAVLAEDARNLDIEANKSTFDRIWKEVSKWKKIAEKTPKGLTTF